jgi:hypothetical protein
LLSFYCFVQVSLPPSWQPSLPDWLYLFSDGCFRPASQVPLECFLWLFY